MDAVNQIIATGLRAGATRKAIAERAGISAPAVSQRIRRHPELRRLRRANDRRVLYLTGYRRQLHDALLDVEKLARQIRRALKEIDEEIAASEVNALLNLRAQ